MRRTLAIARMGAVVLGACLLVEAAVQAQTRSYPEKSVCVVVPAPPGSAPDFLVRLVGQKLDEIWLTSRRLEDQPLTSGMYP